GRSRSAHVPSTFAAIAAFASPRPIDAAMSAGVTPRSYVRVLPSGSVTVTFPLAFMIGRRYQRPVSGPRGLSVAPRRRGGAPGVESEQRPELAQHHGRGRVVAARQHCAREIVQRLERRRGVEVVVERGADTGGEGARVGTAGALRGTHEAVQQRRALLEVGV